MEPAVLVSLIGGIAGIAAAVVTARATVRTSQKKLDADERAAVRQIEAGAYERARESYEVALRGMQGEITRQAAQINALQRQVARLIKQVREAGLVPVMTSEDEA